MNFRTAFYRIASSVKFEFKEDVDFKKINGEFQSM